MKLDNRLIDGLDRLPVGVVLPFSHGAIETGWFECNGAAISRETYSALFAKLGVLYGAGDGSTTFNLPDYRGQFLRGFDNGKGIDAGRTLGSNQLDSFGSHNHETVDTSGFALTGTVPFSKSGNVRTGGAYGSTYASNTTMTAPQGGGETRPKNVSVVYCIKAFDYIANATNIDLATISNDVNNLTKFGSKISLSQQISLNTLAEASVAIPAGVKRIKMMFSNVSGSTANAWYIQLGTSAGVKTSDYYTECHYVSTGITPFYGNTMGFIINQNQAAANHFGTITLDCAGNNTWIASGNIGSTNSTSLSVTGFVALPGECNKIVLTYPAGVFDAGWMVVSYE